jgi:hypothetical protein
MKQCQSRQIIANMEVKLLDVTEQTLTFCPNKFRLDFLIYVFSNELFLYTFGRHLVFFLRVNIFMSQKNSLKTVTHSPIRNYYFEIFLNRS